MNIPKTVALFTKTGSDTDFSYTKRSIEILSSHGIATLLPTAAKGAIPLSAHDLVRFLPDEKTMIREADMLLVLGGDGTMIGYSVMAAELDKPVAGVNLGTLGFLTALERTELDGLHALATGEFTIEERMLLDAEIVDENGISLHSQRIVNDVIITTGIRSKIAEFSLSSGSGKLLDYRADGVVVATPTGSTAYSFSAGGPVIDPTAAIISLTPLCPHTLLRGSVLLSPDTELTVSGRTRDTVTDIHVTMDGKNSRLISEHMKIHIKRSAYTAKIVKIGTNRFYDILETKLNRKKES